VAQIVKVMTRNLFLGAVQRTDFATRAAGLADEVEATRPDLIGLQEAAQWRTDDTVAADHLDLLEAELAGRGRRAAGFDDAWTSANPGDPTGFTCCHRERLDDPADPLRARIDVIVTLEPV
jgi:endonuclease/exonuclease/phosphatase family metal-dependent hydrolase